MRRGDFILLVAGAVATWSLAGHAQNLPAGYPDRPITLIVPYAPGGGNDVLARAVAEPMGKSLGQRLVIENRGGAGGSVGTRQVAKAAPDGYTLLMAIDSTLTMNQFLYRTPPYDPVNDFVPITLVAKTMVLLMVNSSSEVKTVNDLIGKAHEYPGKLNFGAGTISSKQKPPVGPKPCVRSNGRYAPRHQPRRKSKPQESCGYVAYQKLLHILGQLLQRSRS